MRICAVLESRAAMGARQVSLISCDLHVGPQPNATCVLLLSKPASLDVCNRDLALRFHRYSRTKKANQYSCPESNFPPLGTASFPRVAVTGDSPENIQQHLARLPA